MKLIWRLIPNDSFDSNRMEICRYIMHLNQHFWKQDTWEWPNSSFIKELISMKKIMYASKDNGNIMVYMIIWWTGDDSTLIGADGCIDLNRMEILLYILHIKRETWRWPNYLLNMEPTYMTLIKYDTKDIEHYNL